MREPSIELLIQDTARAIRIASCGCCGIDSVIFVFLCRAYEARVSPEEVREMLGTASDCVLDRAGLGQLVEDEVLKAYALYDAVVRELYGARPTPTTDSLG